MSKSFEYHLNMFHTLVDQLRQNYGTPEEKKHLYYLDNQGQEALFTAQQRIRQLEEENKRIKEMYSWFE